MVFLNRSDDDMDVVYSRITITSQRCRGPILLKKYVLVLHRLDGITGLNLNASTRSSAQGSPSTDDLVLYDGWAIQTSDRQDIGMEKYRYLLFSEWPNTADAGGAADSAELENDK